jgi:hypothetical protein
MREQFSSQTCSGLRQLRVIAMLANDPAARMSITSPAFVN